MTLWFVLALMTAAAVFAVLWPLSRPPAVESGSELAVYRDQLGEIDRDRAAALIGEADAAAARIEVSRRLLAAASAPPLATQPRLTLRRGVALVALIALPLFAVTLYLSRGMPAMPSFPLAARQQAPVETAPLEQLVAKVEAHLEKNPADGRGWEVLAPVLVRLGRGPDAVRAYRNIVTYQGETAARRADLGEAIAMAAGGVVTADARREFDRAAALDASEAKARYYLGLAAQQDRDPSKAARIWQDLLKNAPADAPWRPLVEQALAANGSLAPQLSADAVAAVKDMSAEQRQAMVGEMVQRLAERLRTNGDDIDGWLRLVRAYKTLGDEDKARQAIADARRAVDADPERLRNLNAAIKRLGFES